MKGDNTRRKKARHSGKRQTPYPHEMPRHMFLVTHTNDPDNDNDNDAPGGGDTDADAPAAP